jgi:hypothetical protein
VNISEKVVRRLMKQACPVAATSKRRRYGSTMGEISPAPENLLNRDFGAGAPNEKWLTDITKFQIPAGKAYLLPMIGCFDGMVISGSIGTRPDAELVNTMLDAAIGKVAASGDRPLVHSDRGGDYRWPGWLRRIAEAKLVRDVRTLTLFVGNNRLQLEQLGVQPQVQAERGPERTPGDGCITAVMVRPIGTLAMMRLMLHGAMGTLGEAENVERFEFEHMVVRPTLAPGRRGVKVAFDGEVTRMRSPLDFRVLAKPLYLLKPDPLAAATETTMGVTTTAADRTVE